MTAQIGLRLATQPKGMLRSTSADCVSHLIAIALHGICLGKLDAEVERASGCGKLATYYRDIAVVLEIQNRLFCQHTTGGDCDDSPKA